MPNAHQGIPGCWKQALPLPGKVWPPSAGPAGWCNAFSPLLLQDLASEIRVQARSQDTADHKQEVLLDKAPHEGAWKRVNKQRNRFWKSRDVKNLEVSARGQHLQEKCSEKKHSTWGCVYSEIFDPFIDSGFQSQHFGFFLWFKPKNTVFSNLLVVFGSWVTTSEMMRSCRGTYYGSLCVHFHTHRPFLTPLLNTDILYDAAAVEVCLTWMDLLGNIPKTIHIKMLMLTWHALSLRRSWK